MTGGVSLPPCPTPNKINFRAGFNWGIQENFRDLEIMLYPNRGRQSGGAEPRERDKILEKPKSAR